MTERKTVHESVLVGYFCQACGWIQRDVEARRPRNADESEDRLLRAVNLSHNPLDPAVGDLILQLDDDGGKLPQKFFIFELKATWVDRTAERNKMLKKLGADLATAKQHLTQLLTDFPRAQDSHLFGGLTTVADGPRRFSALLVGLYWEAIFREDVPSKRSVFHWLSAIVGSDAKGGMTFDELAAYIERVNSLAEVGGAAQTGASRFVVAYQDYQLYLFQEDAVRELVLERRRKQERMLEQQQLQPRSVRARDHGPR